MSQVAERAAANGWVARATPYPASESPVGGALQDLYPSPEIGFRKSLGPPPVPPPPEANVGWPVVEALPPLDQGVQATCVAHATCSTLEARIARHGLPPIRLAPRFLHFCLARTGPLNGIALRKLRGTLMSHGAPIDAGGDSNIVATAMCPADSLYGRLKIGSVSELSGTDDIKRAISQRGPVVAHMDQHDDFWSHYQDGVYRPSPGASTSLRHAVSVVGYSDSGGYWICRNSRGPEWGVGGYFKLAYGTCGVGDGEPAYEINPVLTPLQ